MFPNSVISTQPASQRVLLWYTVDMSNLREEADRVFSIMIRVTYSDFQGYVSCYTCGLRLLWQEAQNGHFIRRGHSIVRYDEDNCRPQCKICNEFKNGMEEAFEEHLREDIGEEEVDALLKRGQGEKNYSDDEYREIINKCKVKIKARGVTI